jgi:hypothetical protein
LLKEFEAKKKLECLKWLEAEEIDKISHQTSHGGILSEQGGSIDFPD